MGWLRNFFKRRKLKKLKNNIKELLVLFNPSSFYDRNLIYRDVLKCLSDDIITINKIDYSTLSKYETNLYFLSSRELLNNIKNRTDDSVKRIDSVKNMSLWLSNYEDINDIITNLKEVLLDAVKYNQYKNGVYPDGSNIEYIDNLVKWGEELTYWYKTFLNSNKLSYLIIDVLSVLNILIDLELRGDSHD